MKDELSEILEWICRKYAFNLKGNGVFTGKEFAEFIDKHFVCEPYEPMLNNNDEAQNLVAKHFAELCILSISVGWDDKIECKTDFSKVTLKHLLEWGVTI